MLPLERIVDEHWVPLLIQVILFAYLLSYFIISLRRVYHAGWKIAIAKASVVLLAYMGLVTVVLDKISQL